MHVYGIALFFHLGALIAATVASALTHFGEHRLHRATTAAEARPWLALVAGVSKVFPLALLTLLATGSYMVHRAWTWDAGWVDAALLGVALLFVGGLTLDRRGRATAGELERVGDGPLDARAASFTRNTGTSALSWAMSMLALAVVLDMATKPALPLALAVLAAGVLVGVAIALRTGREREAHAAALRLDEA